MNKYDKYFINQKEFEKQKQSEGKEIYEIVKKITDDYKEQIEKEKRQNIIDTQLAIICMRLGCTSVEEFKIMLKLGVVTVNYHKSEYIKYKKITKIQDSIYFMVIDRENYESLDKINKKVD